MSKVYVVKPIVKNHEGRFVGEPRVEVTPSFTPHSGFGAAVLKALTYVLAEREAQQERPAEPIFSTSDRTLIKDGRKFELGIVDANRINRFAQAVGAVLSDYGEDV